MDGIEKVLTMIDRTINTERKRHIAGGILLSISMLFGGLAVTVITIKKAKGEEKEYELCI